MPERRADAAAERPPTPTPTAHPTAAATTGTTSATPAGQPAVAAGWTKLRADVAPSPREDHTWTVSEDGTTAYLFGGRAGSDGSRRPVGVRPRGRRVVRGRGRRADPRRASGTRRSGCRVGASWCSRARPAPTFFNDLWLFDPVASSWSELPAGGDVPVARYGSCAALGPDGRLWISHGFTEDGVRFSDTRAYDFGTGTWTDADARRPIDPSSAASTAAGSMPQGHSCCSAARRRAWSRSATCGGSRTRAAQRAAWAMLEGDLPSARNLYAHATAGGDRLVFGGRGKDGYGNELWAFDLATEAARQLPAAGDAPPGRSGAELVVDAARGRALLFGGKHDGGTFQDLWQLGLG